MEIAFHGAAQTVTGSRHLLEINGKRLLLDCGLYQGRRKDTYERNLNFPFEPTSIDAVILSHAHIDHSGNLPNLVRQGFEGPIYATGGSAHLSDLMLRDSGHIQESDVAYLNKKRARKGDPPLEPLYTAADAAEATRLLEQRQYDRPFEPVPGVLVTFVDAGHILGSAGVVLDLEENGRKLRLMFSGDIGRRDLPLLRDPVLPQDVDVLIMESTYGDRSHESPEQAFEQFQQVVKRTVDRGGKVIIPAFAVGRTQTLVYCLHQMIDHNDIPRIPVFVDSPLAINITAVFREYPQYFDQEAKHFLEQDPHGTIFGFDLIRYTPSVEESKAINEYDGPAVIISASGMAEVGRILHHLKNNIEEARNSVLITSWMAPHTLGRRLLEGEKKVKIFGEQYRVRADVVTLNGLSAHAGREPLIDYALASKGRLKKVFLVHGEARAAEPLMQSLSERGLDVSFPALGDRFEM